MPSQRKRRSSASKRALRRRQSLLEEELRLWDRMPPVGREFGSPDFERLMAEDQRDEVLSPDAESNSIFSKAS